MKYLKSTLLALLVVSVFSCSKDDDSPNPGNQAPDSFNLITVPDGSTDVDLNPTFSWEPAIDPDGDAVSYDVYLDTENPPTTAVASNLSDITYIPQDNLNSGDTYYWAVVAKDGNQGETLSNVASFTTVNQSGPIVLSCDSFQRNNADAISLLENGSSDVDYIIDCVASVELDLKIEPGVVIEFADGAGMIIRDDGSLNAIGTQNEPIALSAITKAKGAWKGILSGSESVKNQFDYVNIEYAGDGGLTSNSEPASLILGATAYFRLNNVSIENSLNYGIAATSYNYNVEINNSTITNCSIPIFTNVITAGNISGGNFTGNATDVIRLVSGSGANVMDVSTTWKELGVPYRMASNLVINNGAKFTIEPGVVIEFEDTKGIEIDKLFDEGSAIIAEGTPTNPITFTGVTKVPGAWKAISVRRTTSVQNKIDNVLIEYAGGAGAGGAIEMWVDPVLTVTNTTFKDIDACALYNRYGSTNPNLTESNNTLVNVNGGYMCHD
ncbi:fibronectin type III domain-containing protein [Marixanthomonas ophiurae]|uniref:Fibronectin type-III domain-containing protein n=1 Tax=Marixanthomonas ophiurae TaxID=387659 RepID=A0A3E1Q9V8_9FLAO|nr:fibronectin type III domain-containing protein [Marixanthomonas ophiurae]RFN58913.1 hypothetical protein DZ858_02185 [Marixanthomonas ophiurae]